jgi:phospholipid N-methyltransferase
MRPQWAEYRLFWRQFRRASHRTGAVMPSGRALSAALSRFVRDGKRQVAGSAAADPGLAVSETRPCVGGRRILEVGPGTGAVTTRIIRDMRPGDQLLLVEQNDQFVEHLRQRILMSPPFSDMRDRLALFHAAVEDLPEERQYDLIISGLPLNNFSVSSVEHIFAKLRRMLAPGGTLSFFEYVAIRRVKSLVSRARERARLREISRAFREVLDANEVCRELVLANVPPAWVHHVRFETEGSSLASVPLDFAAELAPRSDASSKLGG